MNDMSAKIFENSNPNDPRTEGEKYLFAENFENYYGCIETVVYFHIASKDKALAFCDNKDRYTITCLNYLPEYDYLNVVFDNIF